MRLGLIAGLMATAVLASACGRSMKELNAMDDEQLARELWVAKHQTIGFGGYDKQVRQAILDKHPEWSATVRTAIGEQRVTLGMTKAQVGASWGAPLQVGSSLRPEGERIFWRYGRPQSGDGVLPTMASNNEKSKCVYFGPSGLVVGVDQ